MQLVSSINQVLITLLSFKPAKILAQFQGRRRVTGTEWILLYGSHKLNKYEKKEILRYATSYIKSTKRLLGPLADPC